MKVIVACFAIIATVATAMDLPPDVKATLNTICHECMAKTGVDETLIKNAMEGNFADDQKLKDQMHCVLHTFGFFDDNGDLQMDKIKADMHIFLTDPVKEEIFMGKCLVKKENPAQTAFDTFKCLYDVCKS